MPGNLPPTTNGSEAAAILSAGIGCFILPALAIAADKLPAVKSALVFYRPTGPLAGVTTTATAIRLINWGILDVRWMRKNPALTWANVIPFTLVILGLLFTLHPTVGLFSVPLI